MSAVLLEPDFLVDEGGEVRGGPLLVEGGRIAALGAEAATAGAEATRVPLPGRFLLPGFANAHSHAFQRVFRGRVERRAEGEGRGDFWTWRELMYQAALSLSLDEIERVAAWCYLDMLRSGFTAVGEFHYLHHDEGGRPYADPAEVSRRLARAAAKVGVRLVLLQTAYARAGGDAPLAPAQRRFVFPDVEAFLAHAAAIRRSELEGAVTHGLALHSVRACPRGWIEAVAQTARASGLPLHVHACEQPAEIAACLEEHGVAPLTLLEEALALGPNTCVVHATHLEQSDPARLARAESVVCLCPSTERNLGDGMAPIADLVAAGVPLCVGSDSHARVDVVDELRSLEDHERLRLLRRSVLPPAGRSLRHAVVPAGTAKGAQALGLESGRLRAGAPADLVAVRAPLERAAGPDAAVDAWLVGGSGGDVSDVFVGGEAVLKGGAPARCSRDEVEAGAAAVLERLSGRG